MIRSSAFVLAVAIPLLACASANRTAATGSDHGAESAAADRKIIRSGSLSISVLEPDEVAPKIQRIVKESGGFVEHSTSRDGSVSFRCRVPAPKLDEVMDAIAALGKVTSRSLSEADVSDQYVDLETRLRNNIALRDRLQQLLARAEGVKDVLAIEKELTRIQTEIETMQKQLDRLKSEVALSPLSIELEQKRILGPLGYVIYGLQWGIQKLFVIR